MTNFHMRDIFTMFKSIIKVQLSALIRKRKSLERINLYFEQFSPNQSINHRISFCQQLN
eukprot:TRINITY_DN3190_c0_g3_i3.p1 TRINITY_DN3190_c0_g3~~TRINITY_DN3190_c0_g3_i3.p1  ORF type:complete len:59 (-),score=1.57 TRINITY_DN3190_c0_g3_i3:70-246(-)